MLEVCILGGQRDEAKRVNVENAVFVARGYGAVFVRGPGDIVIVTMRVYCCVVVGIGVARQRMDPIEMPVRKLVRMRWLGGGGSGPGKRCGHEGRHDATRKSHRQKLHVQLFLRREQEDDPANR